MLEPVEAQNVGKGGVGTTVPSKVATKSPPEDKVEMKARDALDKDEKAFINLLRTQKQNKKPAATQDYV